MVFRSTLSVLLCALLPFSPLHAAPRSNKPTGRTNALPPAVPRLPNASLEPAPAAPSLPLNEPIEPGILDAAERAMKALSAAPESAEPAPAAPVPAVVRTPPARPARWDKDVLKPAHLSARNVTKTTALSALLEAKLKDALTPFFDGGAVVLSRGSTARLTHTGEETDFDLTVAVPADWKPQRLKKFLTSPRGDDVRDAVREALKPLLKDYPGHELELKVSQRKDIMRPRAGGAPGTQPVVDENAHLLTARIIKPGKTPDSEGQFLKVDILFSNHPHFINGYPEYFKAQMDQVARMAGSQAVQSLLSDIRLAKRLFKQTLKAYKFYEGGPAGVGIEQMVMQAGSIESPDQGRTLSTPGGIEAMFLRVLRAAYDPSGRLRSQEDAAGRWVVHSPFIPPHNFLDLLSKGCWERLVIAARNYFHAKLSGKTTTTQKLVPGASQPLELLEEGLRGLLSDAPGSITLQLLNRFTTLGPAPSERGLPFLLAQGAVPLPRSLGAFQNEEVFPNPERKEKRSRRKKPGARNRRSGIYYGTMIRNGKQLMFKALKGESFPLPGNWGTGTPSGTLVRLSYEGDTVRVTRMGTRPQDMIVGKVVRSGNGFNLAPALSDGPDPMSYYGVLPIAQPQIPLEEGHYVQAFVGMDGKTLSAAPLADLGDTLTPGIAARELAFLQGARGYFSQEVIAQAEERVERDDPKGEFLRAKERLAANGRPEPLDLRADPFVTIDPPGAGDLDDAYHITKEKDGTYTWRLATALIGHYVRPGTPAFLEAARAGNTLYSIDKNGIPEFPMNHPAISKYAASLVPGKDSLAMVTTMRFSAEGKLLEQSDVRLGIVRVQGRYSYPQVAAFWKGEDDVDHKQQINLARELAAKLGAQDDRRGKLDLRFTEAEYRQDGPGGEWKVVVEETDPLNAESHHVIEMLKVYGNRIIAHPLEGITKKYGIPHISRVHPPQDEDKNERLKLELAGLGMPWNEDEDLAQYLKRLHRRKHEDWRLLQVIQLIALRTRNPAIYTLVDIEGHEGLALKPGEYDHPSAGIRRFSDMYNLTLLDAELKGEDVPAVYEAILADLRALGFDSLDSFVRHLNEREDAADRMDRMTDRFMAAYELAKPEYQGRRLAGFVKSISHGNVARAVIQIEDPYVTVVVNGDRAEGLELMDKVSALVEEADPASLTITLELH